MIVTDELEGTLLRIAQEYDTVCIGATRESAVKQAIVGAIPEIVGERAPGTVVMVRGSERASRTIREALIEWLSRG